MPILWVLANDQGDVLGTAPAPMQGQGAAAPGRISLAPQPGQKIIQVEVDEDVLSLDALTLHEYVKAKYLWPATEVVSSKDTAPKAGVKGAGDPLGPSREGGDYVMTPAGPIEKSQVHPVNPNEAVRRNEDNTYTVVPKEPEAKPK